MKLHYGNLLKDDKYVKNRFEKYYLLTKDFFNQETSHHNKTSTKATANKPLSILDIGGYTADMLVILKNKKIKIKDLNYLVLDADREALKIAKKRGAKTQLVNLHEKNALSKIKRKFDIIFCTEVLEHLLYPEDILSSIKKLVKKDGAVIVSLPNENTIFHRIYSFLGLGIDACAFEPFKHLHLPTISQSRKFVSRYFTIEKELYFINFSGKASRFEGVGMLLSLIPESIWQILANIFPNLLARGIVFKLRP